MALSGEEGVKSGVQLLPK